MLVTVDKTGILFLGINQPRQPTIPQYPKYPNVFWQKYHQKLKKGRIYILPELKYEKYTLLYSMHIISFKPSSALTSSLPFEVRPRSSYIPPAA